MISNLNYLSTGTSTWLRFNQSEIIMGKAIKGMILKALCSQGAYITSYTDSFLCVIKTFPVPFKNKTLVRRCFFGWRSSCLDAGLISENRNDVSVESTWATYFIWLLKICQYTLKEILREAVLVTDLLLPMTILSPSFCLFISPV